MTVTLEKLPASDVETQLQHQRRSRQVRSLGVTVTLGLLAFVVFVLTMMVGSYRLTGEQVLRSIFGVGSTPEVDFIVLDLRLPQATAGFAVGLALGVAGTLFQRLLRNPLASPDFVGVSSGASLAAVTGIVVLHAQGLTIPALALGGALVSSVLMYLLAFKDGISGYRFILIGIGVSAFMSGLVSYVITRGTLSDAREAMHWLVGSVGLSGAAETRVLLVGLIVLLPLTAVLSKQLRSLELGDDSARALGTRVQLAHLALIAVSVALTGLATAVAGPIVFVALVAGPVANRLLGPAAGGVLAAGFVGATLLMSADLVAVHMFPAELPTGVVTGLVGAPYLLWLLATSNKEGAGG